MGGQSVPGTSGGSRPRRSHLPGFAADERRFFRAGARRVDLAQRAEHLTALYEAALALGGVSGLHERLDRLCQAAARLVGADQADFGLLDERGEWITYRASYG